MRKMTIDLYPNEMIRKIQEPMMQYFHSFKLLEMLRIDFGADDKVGLMLFNAKENVRFQDIEFPEHIEILSTLKSEGSTHICVVKSHMVKQFEQLNEILKVDVIWSTPIISTKEKTTFTVIGDQKSLMKLIDGLKQYGEVDNISFQKAAYHEHDILTVLTKKQKEVLIAALQYGYYAYPRKINSEQLSKKVNISKATLIGHLRKAEGRLLTHVFTGY